MNVLFTISLMLYFAATLLCFAGAAFRKEGLKKAALLVLLIAVAAHLIYVVWRGIAAHRLPLANQFEFATAFAWGIGLMAIVLRRSIDEPWLGAAGSASAFLILSFAALQPRKISELMPALRSAWFSFHIGSAVFSYSAFVIAACFALRYLSLSKKTEEGD